ncbi:F-box only protein 30 [Halotydeus destructor]|nr:F-box only protein 30 [Halotydeus destructor]
MPPNSVLGDVETDHSHCAQCIVLKRCSYLTQKRDATCPVVSCKFDCAAKFHECQLDEHLLLCSNYSVPCLNRYYGCPFVLPRRQMSAHLPRCPASVVHCSAEWNRWPAHTREKPHYQNPHLISSNADQLEIALALRDQRALKELWDAPRETRRAFRNNLTKKYPAVPLKPYQGRLKVRDSRSSTSSPTVINTQTTTTDDESESSPWTKTYPGLQKSICEKLADYNNDTKLDDAKKLSLEECKAQSNDIPPAPHQVALSLDISIDTIAPYQPKPRQMYTFRCAKELRRDEFGDHYKNVHSDIHGSVNGWMEYRCPLWQYGCSFTRRRLYPKPVGSKIVYHSAIESLGHSILPDDAGCQQLTSHLPSLPSEVSMT